MSPAGSSAQRGFTLLELMVVFAVVAALIGLSVPAGMRLYDTMTYRDAVREMSSTLSSARFHAISSGQTVDVVLDTREKTYGIGSVEDGTRIPEELSVEAVYARDLSRVEDTAVYRFYPDGGASGGSVTLVRDSGAGVRLRVDWLLGRVTQEPPEGSAGDDSAAVRR